MYEFKVIPFMRYRIPALVLSGILVLVSLGSLLFNGLNYGLDFTGGTRLEVLFTEAPDLDEVRSVLSDAGYPNHEVIFYGTDTDVLIRLQDTSEAAEENTGETALRVVDLLQAGMDPGVELKESGFVSSVVGDELREQGGLGMLVAMGMIMLYIALRFQFKFSVAAVLSLVHDTILVLGFFSVTGLSFDLTVLAAVLAMIGYSLNDTIVVADRIRENFRVLRGKTSEEVIDIAVTQTLARTMITSMTTLLVLLALYWFGGEILRGFSIALIVGIFFGTTSSIYIAAGVLLMMHISKEDLMPPVRDQEELDSLP